MTGDQKETGSSSFNLTKENRQGSQLIGGIQSPELNWQEQAYERLKILYGISKLLSWENSVETAFIEILTMCHKTLPFVTATMIEKRKDKIVSSIWHSKTATETQILNAKLNAKKSFAYMTGNSLADFDFHMTTQIPLDLNCLTVPLRTDASTIHEEFIVLPLIIDRMPPFGVFQFEGYGVLTEKDLEFADALASLIGIAVDRYHRSQVERELNAHDSKESSDKLSHSEAHVTDLVTERELREVFVALLSHDLRTPLAASKMAAQLIQRQPEKLETVLSLAARIVSSVDRADQMIGDLLDANRIRSGEILPLQIESFDLNELVKETLDDLTTIHGDRFILKTNTKVIGNWDRKGLRRIIENLCNNAIKYGDFQTPVQLFIRLENNLVQLEVQNWGNVISIQDQKTLFTQFRRGENVSGSIKGWGIGLTLVRGVAEAHGGSVQVQSNIQQGTTFTLKLPLDSSLFVSKKINVSKEGMHVTK